MPTEKDALLSKKAECPKCSAAKCDCVYCEWEGKSDFLLSYLCGSDITQEGDFYPSWACKQLAQQAELLRECREMVRVIKKGDLCQTRNSKGEYMFTSIRINDDDLLILPKAQALLPKLEALKEAEDG